MKTHIYTPPTANKNPPAEKKKDDPLEVLKSAVNKVVLVRLRNGLDYVGTLELINNEMDIVLKDCVQLDKITLEPARKYGRLVVRGNNVEFIDINYTPS